MAMTDDTCPPINNVITPLSTTSPSSITSQHSPIRHLHEFLDSFRVARGSDHTHTSLDPRGSYYISNDALDRFFSLYTAAMLSASNDSGAVVHLTERHRHVSPICIDIDIRLAENRHGQRIYTQDHIDNFLKIYTKHLVEHVQVRQNSGCVLYYVMEKPNPTLDSVKDGIHVMAPHVVTRCSIQHMIRDEVLLEDDVLELFREMGCRNEASDVFDEAVITRNNWLMYGSSKASGSPPYRVSRIVEVDLETFEIHTLTTPIPSATDLVEILSLRNKTHEIPVQDMYLDCVRRLEEREALSRIVHSPTNDTNTDLHGKHSSLTDRKARDDTNGGDGIDQHGGSCDDTAVYGSSDVDLAKRLVMILDPVRSERYTEWMTLGWCLYNISRTQLLDCWILFSRQSSKFVVGDCERRWESMHRGNIGMGTLRKWARDDNETEYNKIVRSCIRDLVFSSMTGTHYDVALVALAIFKGRYVCASIKNRSWYEFRGHRWVPCDNGYLLRRSLSTTVWSYFVTTSADMKTRGKDASNDGDKEKYEDMVKKLTQLAHKLRTSSFKDNVMRECSELFYEERFEDRLDANVHLIGFENGVFDLDAYEFREGRPEDYVSFSTGVSYAPYDSTNPRVTQINSYMEQVLVNEDVRKYVWRLFASFLHGGIREQKFHIWTGSGSNSKSKLIELFEKSFGDYCCKFPVTLLTQKRVASNAANSELAKAKGKRLATLQEPSEDEKINIGLMKELSGGDRIMARCIYKEPVEFHPQFKMMLLCNQLPHVPSDDGGTWRRIRVVEFSSKFVDNPIEPNEFPIDVNLSVRLEQWKDVFISMLIHEFQMYKQHGVSEPAVVLRCTNEYKKQNDHMAEFVEMYIEQIEGYHLPVCDVMAELKQYIQAYSINNFKAVKSTVESYICRCFRTNVFVEGGQRKFRDIRMRQATIE